MKYTLATLALLGLVSVEEVNAMNLNHRHQHKHRHMKKDDDDKDEVKETAHPPKEVSEYTQDMVKADVKKNWYKDHAFNVTDLSYNSGDKKPTDHNNGFTNAQKNSSSNSTVSLVQARYGPTTEINSTEVLFLMVSSHLPTAGTTLMVVDLRKQTTSGKWVTLPLLQSNSGASLKNPRSAVSTLL